MTVVLGIESSCDETAVAVVDSTRVIRAQALASQTQAHAPYGGVVPEIAARAHLQHMDRLVVQTLRDAQLTWEGIDAIAVTAGPGLIGGVMVGVMTGKALGAALGKPVIAVNHLEGHALTVRLTHAVAFPYFLLLVSGGHCQLLVVHGVGNYQLLGTTRDDALGEAFDKCAKLMGLPYPGGPAIEVAARAGNPQRYVLPKPMVDTEHSDFSFSGLKTAVRLLVEREVAQAGRLSATTIADIAASFQYTVGQVLQERTSKALSRIQNVPITAFAVAGGVAANHYVRSQLQQVAQAHGMPLVVAPPALCTDNAAMIAWAGLERFSLGVRDDLAFEPRARWPLASLQETA